MLAGEYIEHVVDLLVVNLMSGFYNVVFSGYFLMLCIIFTGCFLIHFLFQY